jgi:hypothetical protein
MNISNLWKGADFLLRENVSYSIVLSTWGKFGVFVGSFSNTSLSMFCRYINVLQLL